MGTHLVKKSSRPMLRRDERRRAVLLTSTTCLIVILGALWTHYHTYHQTRPQPGNSLQITILGEPSFNQAASAHAYRFLSVYASSPINDTIHHLPSITMLTAPSLSQAIETFANKYSLTVDSVESNYVSFITKNGLEVTTYVHVIKSKKH